MPSPSHLVVVVAVAAAVEVFVVARVVPAVCNRWVNSPWSRDR